MLRKLMPRFLGIGAMRSGTSWLAAHLEAHPQVWMKAKEIHFFNRKIHRRRLPLPTAEASARIDYAVRFLPGTIRGKVTGEVTPAYGILEREMIEKVRSWIPDAKLLFIMRDPVERAWSQARKDFPEFTGKPVGEASRAELTEFLDSSPVRRRGDYAACLASWMSVYPRERFWLGFLDDVKADPEGALRDVFGFLGLDLAVPLDRSRVAAPVGAGEPVSMPDWVRAHLSAPPLTDVAALEEIVGRRVPWAER